jgi:hypothetical protein
MTLPSGRAISWSRVSSASLMVFLLVSMSLDLGDARRFGHEQFQRQRGIGARGAGHGGGRFGLDPVLVEHGGGVGAYAAQPLQADADQDRHQQQDDAKRGAQADADFQIRDIH